MTYLCGGVAVAGKYAEGQGGAWDAAGSLDKGMYKLMNTGIVLSKGINMDKGNNGMMKC